MVDEEIEQSPWRAVADRGVGPRNLRPVDSGQIVTSARFRCWSVGWQSLTSQRGDHLARDLAKDGDLALGAGPRQVDSRKPAARYAATPSTKASTESSS